MDSTQSKKRGITYIALEEIWQVKSSPPPIHTPHTHAHTHTHTLQNSVLLLGILRKLWANCLLKNGTRIRLSTTTHLFIADGDDATSVCVHSLETLCERSQHDTALDKVIKLHRLFVAPVKHTGTKVTKLHWSASGTNKATVRFLQALYQCQG